MQNTETIYYTKEDIARSLGKLVEQLVLLAFVLIEYSWESMRFNIPIVIYYSIEKLREIKTKCIELIVKGRDYYLKRTESEDSEVLERTRAMIEYYYSLSEEEFNRDA